MDQLLQASSGGPPSLASLRQSLFEALPMELQVRIITKILQGRHALDSLKSLMEVYPYLQKCTVVMHDLRSTQLAAFCPQLHPIFTLRELRYASMFQAGALSHCARNFPIKIALLFKHNLKIPQSLHLDLPIYNKAIDIATLLVIRNSGPTVVATEFVNKRIARNPATPVKYFWDLHKTQGVHDYDRLYTTNEGNYKAEKGSIVMLRGCQPGELFGSKKYMLSVAQANAIHWRVPKQCFDHQGSRRCRPPRFNIETNNLWHHDHVFISYDGGYVPVLMLLRSSEVTVDEQEGAGIRSFTLYNHGWDPHQPCGEVGKAPDEDEAHRSYPFTHRMSANVAGFPLCSSDLEYVGVADHVLDMTAWWYIKSFTWKRLSPVPGSATIRSTILPILAPSLKTLKVTSVMLKTDSNPLPKFRCAALEELVMEALPGSDTWCDPSQLLFVKGEDGIDCGVKFLKKVALVGVRKQYTSNGQLQPLSLSDLGSISSRVTNLVISQYSTTFPRGQGFCGFFAFEKLEQLTVDIAGIPSMSGRYYKGAPMRQITLNKRAFHTLKTLILDSSNTHSCTNSTVEIICASPKQLKVLLTASTIGLKAVVLSPKSKQ